MVDTVGYRDTADCWDVVVVGGLGTGAGCRDTVVVVVGDTDIVQTGTELGDMVAVGASQAGQAGWHTAPEREAVVMPHCKRSRCSVSGADPHCFVVDVSAA